MLAGATSAIQTKHTLCQHSLQTVIVVQFSSNILWLNKAKITVRKKWCKRAGSVYLAGFDYIRLHTNACEMILNNEEWLEHVSLTTIWMIYELKQSSNAYIIWPLDHRCTLLILLKCRLAVIISSGIQFTISRFSDVHNFSISLCNHAINLSIYSMMEPLSVTFMHIQVY